MVCGIYLITRIDTFQKYVGQAIDIDDRWLHHIKGYDIEHSRIDKAIRKHGVDKFTLQIITELPEDKKLLDIHEKYWVKFYNTYEDKNHYNLTPGGDFNPMLDPDIVKKISGENNYWYGRKNPELSERNYKRTGQKNPNWGTSLVEEWGGLWFLEHMASLDISVYDVVEYTGISRSAIQAYLRTRGYTWTKLKEEVTGNKKYSIDDYGGLEFLKECVNNGKTRKDVANEIGISPQTIDAYLNNLGYNWTKLKEEVTGSKKYSIDDFGGLEFLKECVKNGKTQYDISKETNITEKTIRSYLNKKGYSWTGFTEEVTGNKKYSIDDYGGLEFLKESIKKGKDQKDIAKEINISPTTIRKYLKGKGYTWAQIKTEVDGNIRHSVIDDYGGINFLIGCIKEGKTQTDVAKEIGIASDTIWKYLKRRGYSWTELEEKTGKKKYSIEELGGLDYLIECIKEGKTQADVAKELGISTSSDVIWRYLKSKGYTWTQLKKEVKVD